MVALLPLAMEPQPALSGRLGVRTADDVADLASVLGMAVLRGDKFAAFTTDEPGIGEHVLGTLAESLAEHGIELEFRDPSEIYQLADGLDPATHATSIAIWSPALSDGQAYGRKPVFVIEHAELLPPQTLEVLWLAGTVFLNGPPAPQILFFGDTRFQEMLRSDACRGIRNHIVTNLAVGSGQPLVESEPAPAPAPKALQPTPASLPAPRVASQAMSTPDRRPAARSRIGWIGAGTALLLVGAAGAVRLTGLSSVPGPDQAASVAPIVGNHAAVTPPRPAAPLQGSGDPSTPQAGTHPAAQPAAPAAASPLQPAPSPQSQASAAQPAQPASAAQQRPESGPTRLDQSHVVVLFRAGSDDSQAYARQIAAALDGRVGAVETQAAPALPRVARIHFTAREDRQAAMQLHAILASSLGKTWVHRQTGPRAAPEAGTIEVQLPQQPRTLRQEH